MLRDEWDILDASEKEIGKVFEDSMIMALLRRFLSNLIPQHFRIEVGGQNVGDLKQTFNPFVPQFNVDFTANQGKLDRRLAIGSVILLQIIEGKQQSA